MGLRRLLILACWAVGLLACGTVRPATAAESLATDPYVLLDAAKLLIGEGKLERSREALAEVPRDVDEQFVNEETAIQRILVVGSFLAASHHLLNQLGDNGLDQSSYASWLRSERDYNTRALRDLAEHYLELTEDGVELRFIRFHLPRVSQEHLLDLEIYADPEVLGPAVTNWEDQRDGLGRGLVLVQARVALVVAAAEHYDMPHSQPTLEAVSARLRSGVPFHEASWLSWLARFCREVAQPDDGLEQIARLCEKRAGIPAQLAAPETATDEFAAGSNNTSPGASE